MSLTALWKLRVEAQLHSSKPPKAKRAISLMTASGIELDELWKSSWRLGVSARELGESDHDYRRRLMDHVKMRLNAMTSDWEREMMSEELDELARLLGTNRAEAPVWSNSRSSDGHLHSHLCGIVFDWLNR